jgi:cell surface protein SprA
MVYLREISKGSLCNIIIDYTVNQYRSNFDYDKAPDGVDASGDFFNKTIMSNVNLVEQFSPLIRMDFELKSSLKVLTEIKKRQGVVHEF